MLITSSEYGYVQFSFDNIVCGGFRLSQHSEECIGIWSVEIDPNLRGKGLGQIMMKECIEHIKETYPKVSSAFLLVSATNHSARRVYEKTGFLYKEPENKRYSVLSMEIFLH